MNIVLATQAGLATEPASDTLLREALQRRGAVVSAIPWDEIEISGVNPLTICVRSTWDYHHRVGEFRQWLKDVEQSAVILWNPPATLRWNLDKIYLQELADRGIAIPTTEWFEAGEHPSADRFFVRTGGSHAVIKPRVSATAHGHQCVTRGERVNDVPSKTFEIAGGLIQTFLPEVQQSGEISLMFIDGRFSHAVRKMPRAGDYRVQSAFGGSVEPLPSVTSSLRRFADHVIDQLGHSWMYARVDVIQTARGPVLMECELIEPELFLMWGPVGTERLADALMRTHAR